MVNNDNMTRLDLIISILNRSIYIFLIRPARIIAFHLAPSNRALGRSLGFLDYDLSFD